MPAIISTRQLSRTYESDAGAVHALSDVSLVIDSGELVAVMGPSGSGKSTLMNLLGLLDRPTLGSYLLDGRDASNLNTTQRSTIRNQHIGFVFQAFSLLPRSTAVENVELPLVYAGVQKSLRREKAAAALEVVGLAHRAHHWPRQLSGGEQQRVAIARAIVNDPLLVLADEPTGALDSTTGNEILALFQRLNRKGRTILVVTHDRHVANHCKRLVQMRDGRAVADEPIENPSVATSVRDAGAEPEVPLPSPEAAGEHLG